MTAGHACGLLAAVSVAAASAQTVAPVTARIPVAPTAVAGSDGFTHLGYELHLTNYYKNTGPLRLERVEVFADPGSTALLRHVGDELREWLVHPGDRSRSAEDRSIHGGMSAIVYLWVTLTHGTPLPASLRHRLVFGTEKGTEEILDGASVAVRPTSPAVFGPPIPGGHLARA